MGSCPNTPFNTRIKKRKDKNMIPTPEMLNVNMSLKVSDLDNLLLTFVPSNSLLAEASKSYKPGNIEKSIAFNQSHPETRLVAVNVKNGIVHASAMAMLYLVADSLFNSLYIAKNGKLTNSDANNFMDIFANTDIEFLTALSKLKNY